MKQYNPEDPPLPNISNAKPFTKSTAGTRKLTLMPLIAATFFMVAGGPYGLEEMIKNSGYFWSIVFLLVTPLLWSVPTALMVSELSAALPEEGGYYAWVRRAMGPFWGFQEAWLSLAASVFDMAIYPKLFVYYLDFAGAKIADVNLAWALGSAMIALCVASNILGVRVVGGSSVIMNVLLLVPFAVLTIRAFWLPAAPAMEHPPPKFDFILAGLLFAMWNYMGWDNSSTIAGEVDRPQRTYPLAMLGAALLITVTYLLPVLAASRTGMELSEWDTGAWVKVGDLVWGDWLKIAIAVGGMLSAVGMFNALVMSYSRVPAAMAMDGYLPRFFARCHPRTGAPWVAILACAVAWGLMMPLKLERILAIDIIIYGISLLLEFAALVVLRIREPGLPRPFRVPGGMPAAIVLGIAPAILIGLGVFHERDQSMKFPFLGGWAINALVLCVAVIALGPMVYWIGQWAARRK